MSTCSIPGCGKLHKVKGLCMPCYQKQWRKDNPEYGKQYYQTDKARAQQQRYRDTHKEQIAEKSRKYRQANKELMAKRYSKWQSENPEIVRASYHRRRARILNADGSHTAKDIMALKDLYGERCMNPDCGKPITESNKITIDHIVPLIKGGSNNIDNLQFLCLSCNSSKYTKTKDYRLKPIKEIF